MASATINMKELRDQYNHKIFDFRIRFDHDDGDVVYAHRKILAYFSTYFKSQFEDPNGDLSNSEVYDVFIENPGFAPKAVFKKLVKYFYSPQHTRDISDLFRGEDDSSMMNKHFEKAMQTSDNERQEGNSGGQRKTDDDEKPTALFYLFRIAAFYGIQKLIDICKKRVACDIGRAVYLYSMAFNKNDEVVKKIALELISENAEEVLLRNEALYKTSKSVFEAIIGSDKFKMDIPLFEELIFNAATKWSELYCRSHGLSLTKENKRKALGSALYKIRFPTYPRPTFFAARYDISKLLTEQEMDQLEKFFQKKTEISNVVSFEQGIRGGIVKLSTGAAPHCSPLLAREVITSQEQTFKFSCMCRRPVFLVGFAYYGNLGRCSAMKYRVVVKPFLEGSAIRTFESSGWTTSSGFQPFRSNHFNFSRSISVEPLDECSIVFQPVGGSISTCICPDYHTDHIELPKGELLTVAIAPNHVFNIGIDLYLDYRTNEQREREGDPQEKEAANHQCSWNIPDRQDIPNFRAAFWP